MQLKKILAAGAMGALMAGSSLAMAANLADYPAPFVDDGEMDSLIVVGADAVPSDVAGAIDIAARLGGETKEVVDTGSTEVSVSGESVSMASGSNQIYLKDAINAQRSTITDNDLPTILASGTFTDDGGTNYDYEQSLKVDNQATFEFTDSDGDLDDPALILQIDDTISSSGNFYGWTIYFNSAVDFNDADSKGEKITIAGKEYTIGSSTDSDTLQLLGGSETVYFDTEDEKTQEVTVGEETYTVTLKGVTSTPEAVVQVDDGSDVKTKTLGSGKTKTVNGLEVYIDSVNYYGLESRLGDATIMVGGDELYLEDGQAVMEGSDKDDIDGTVVSWSTDCDSMTTLSIYVSAADNDEDHVSEGDKFVDPVFGTLEFLYADAVNAPEFEADKGADQSDRDSIVVSRGGDRDLNVDFTDENGNDLSVEFVHQGSLQDSNGNAIEIVEGATLEEDEYTILNSGDYQHLIQVTKVNTDDGSGNNGDVHFKDLATGTTYKLDDKAGLDDDGQTEDITINGQTYTVEVVNAASNYIQIYTSDYPSDTSTSAKKVSVFPYLDLVAGKNHKIAFTDDATLGDATRDTIEAQTDDTRVYREYELPTGSLYIGIKDSNVSAIADDDTVEYSTDGSSWTALTAGGAYEPIQVGTVYYQVKSTVDNSAAKSKITVNNIAIETDQAGDGTDAETDPGILFVEEEDNSDSDDKNAVILPMTDDGDYSEADVTNLVLTSPNTYEDKSFDDADYEGNLDSFGTYVLVDKSDSNQDFATLTYPEEQMYGKFYFGETGLETTTTTGDGVYSSVPVTTPVAKLDSELTAAEKETKNLIVVGGPCANDVFAELAEDNEDLASCASWDLAEGEAMIRMVEDAFAEGKAVLLVAGTTADDTRMASAVLQDYENYDLEGTSATVTGTVGNPVVA